MLICVIFSDHAEAEVLQYFKKSSTTLAGMQ